MGPSGERFPDPLDLFEGDRQPKRLKLRDQAPVPVAAALLNALQPGAKAVFGSAFEEVSEQVDGLLARLVLKLELCAQFDGAHQIQPGIEGEGRRLIVARQGVVVADRHRLEPQGDGLFDELCRRVASVGCVAMCVEIDQRSEALPLYEIRPNSKSLLQTRSALTSGDSFEESNVTSA